jgi:uncharacterized membrane protein YeaQ/YmgE (transglycosylase-associated protein family)
VTDDIKAAAEVAAAGAGIGAATGVVRVIVLGQAGGLGAYLSVVIASILVGVLAGLMASSIAIDGSAMSQKMQWVVVIVSSVVAKDFLTGLRAIGSEFASDPLALVIRIVKAIRGK